MSRRPTYDRNYPGTSLLPRRKEATRPALPARLMLSGGPGSGKTLTALRIAAVLAGSTGKVLVVDTEPDQAEIGSSRTYVGEVPVSFDIIEWDADRFDVRDLARTLEDLAGEVDGNDVLVIDGIAPFWNGPGGLLSMVDGVFQNWGNVRPIQAEMMAALSRLRCHVVITCRSNPEWKVEEYNDSDGKTKTRIALEGIAPQFDRNFAYQVQVAAHLDQAGHSLTIMKSRSSELANQQFPPHGGEVVFAETYQGWLEAGQPQATAQQIADLIAHFDGFEDLEVRKQVKQEFVARFGAPGALLAQDYPTALAWVLDSTPDGGSFEETQG